MKYAIVDADGTVVNTVAADSIGDVAVEAGNTVFLATTDAEIGGTFDGQDFARRARPVVPASVPQHVTKLQLVRALRLSGDWGSVKSALKTSGTDTKEDWELSHIIPRDDSLMQGFAQALPLTPAEVDALFIQAAAL